MEQVETQPKDHSPSLHSLFISFLRLGIAAFGGPAMLAHIRRMAVEEKGWLGEGSFRDGVALCQAIPGATAMQASAYVGQPSREIGGAAASFLGSVSRRFFSSCPFQYTPTPIRSGRSFQRSMTWRAIILAIVANATISFGRNSLEDTTPGSGDPGRRAPR